MLLFLKKEVPGGAQKAQNRLEQFDEALFVMGLEARTKAGRRVTFSGPNLVAVAEEWRNVAKKYQQVLEDRPKKSCVIVIQITPMILLMNPLQTLLKSVTCRANLGFDHLLDQLFGRFVYVYDSPLHFQQPSKLLREHVPFKVKATRCRECCGNGLRELGGVGGRQRDLNNGLWAKEVIICK
jgi:hypothetical protein